MRAPCHAGRLAPPRRPATQGMMRVLAASLALGTVTSLSNGDVFAQVLYRYANERGEVVYSDTPNGNAGGAVNRLSRNGTRLSATPVPGAANGQNPARESPNGTTAGAGQTREQEDQARRNTALLATYGSPAELEAARTYALREPLAAMRLAQSGMVAAGRRLNQLKTGGEAAPGSEGAQQLDAASFDFKTQAQLTENKLRELQAINARFDADLQRFTELTRVTAPGPQR